MLSLLGEMDMTITLRNLSDTGFVQSLHNRSHCFVTPCEGLFDSVYKHPGKFAGRFSYSVPFFFSIGRYEGGYH